MISSTTTTQQKIDVIWVSPITLRLHLRSLSVECFLLCLYLSHLSNQHCHSSSQDLQVPRERQRDGDINTHIRRKLHWRKKIDGGRQVARYRENWPRGRLWALTPRFPPSVQRQAKLPTVLNDGHGELSWIDRGNGTLFGGIELTVWSSRPFDTIAKILEVIMVGHNAGWDLAGNYVNSLPASMPYRCSKAENQDFLSTVSRRGVVLSIGFDREGWCVNCGCFVYSSSATLQSALDFREMSILTDLGNQRSQVL